ncbi:MAG: hypothetical protein MUF71_06815 [Candidatus Kapabacteria bacterium]|jgi:phage shock protein A|nr:hypothetical protein [Candidatus Kapabacteria bacterium]
MFRSLFSLLQTRENAPDVSNQAPSADDASRVIDEALREMGEVIERLTAAKTRAQTERDEAAAQLHSYKTAHAAATQRAKALVQEGRSDEARAMLGEQHNLETVIASFERIVGNMSAAVQKLVTQIDSMRLQREELKARRTVLTAQLASATSHEEFVEKLRLSGASHELLERETIHAELRVELESGAGSEGFAASHKQQSDFHAATTEAALQALENSIAKEIAQERAEKERLRNEASLKRFHTAFAAAEKQQQSPTPLREKAPETKQSSSAQTTTVQSTTAQSTTAHNAALNVMNQEQQRRTMEEFFAEQATKTVSPPVPKPVPTPASTPVSTSQTEQSAESTDDKIRNFFLHNP